jgi:hypothetical protein
MPETKKVHFGTVESKHLFPAKEAVWMKTSDIPYSFL